MSEPKKAIVVGAGIGGLATAIGLRRNGIETEVYERREDTARLTSGGGFMLFNNALLALRELKLDERTIELGEIIDVHEFRSDRGRRLARWDLDVPARQMGAPAIALRRSNLNTLLLDEVGDVVTMGAQCVGVEQDEHGAAVSFSGGRTAEADVVIGADGLRSVVRTSLRHGHDLPPRYAGYTAWQAITRNTDESQVPGGTFFNLWGRKGLRFLYCRLNSEEVYWDAIVSDRTGARFDMLRKNKRSVMGEHFAGWPDPIPRIVEETDEDAILPIDIFDRPPGRRPDWGIGRVTLVGDAAHPMTLNLSQGAGQAIEDGVALSRGLSATTDVASTLAWYERYRHARTATMVGRAYKIGALGRIHNPFLCRLREVVMRGLFDRVVQRQTNKLVADVRF